MKGLKSKVEKAVDKIQKLRIFADSEGKTNLPITAVQGGLLVISQFTLYADCRKGNRPSFTEAAPPALAGKKQSPRNTLYSRIFYLKSSSRVVMTYILSTAFNFSSSGMCT
jgi:D-tyrosyl-tRNA(Tyr) deacylase